MIRLGIIGYGYWGPQVARNFHSLNGCELSVICDKSSRITPSGQTRLSRSISDMRRQRGAMFTAR